MKPDEFQHDGVERLLFINQSIQDLKNQHALLSKAKNAYISDLSSDIVHARSGVDLGALFSDD